MGTSVTMQKSAAIVCLAALLSGANARSLMKMVPASSVDNRVINGNTASLGDFPHAVAILMDGRSLCTGSLISDQWVLTAGHCVEGVSSFDITAGSVSRDSSNLSEGGVVVPASTSILHESYGSLTMISALSCSMSPFLSLTTSRSQLWLRPTLKLPTEPRSSLPDGVRPPTFPPLPPICNTPPSMSSPTLSADRPMVAPSQQDTSAPLEVLEPNPAPAMATLALL